MSKTPRTNRLDDAMNEPLFTEEFIWEVIIVVCVGFLLGYLYGG